MFSETLYCGEGKCTTFWRERDYGLYCNDSSGYTVQFTLIDKDGHLSIPYEMEL